MSEKLKVLLEIEASKIDSDKLTGVLNDAGFKSVIASIESPTLNRPLADAELIGESVLTKAEMVIKENVVMKTASRTYEIDKVILPANYPGVISAVAENGRDYVIQFDANVDISGEIGVVAGYNGDNLTYPLDTAVLDRNSFYLLRQAEYYYPNSLTIPDAPEGIGPYGGINYRGYNMLAYGAREVASYPYYTHVAVKIIKDDKIVGKLGFPGIMNPNEALEKAKQEVDQIIDSDKKDIEGRRDEPAFDKDGNELHVGDKVLIDPVEGFSDQVKTGVVGSFKNTGYAGARIGVYVEEDGTENFFGPFNITKAEGNIPDPEDDKLNCNGHPDEKEANDFIG